MTDKIMVQPELKAELDRIDSIYQNRSRWTLIISALILIYLTTSFIQFDLGSISQKWHLERASRFILDTYAHKDHVTLRWSKPDEFRIAFEGGYREIYTEPPEWFSKNNETGASTVEFDNGGKISFFKDRVEMTNWPNTNETFVFKLGYTKKTGRFGKQEIVIRPEVVGYENRRQDLPSWIQWTENNIVVRPSLFERLHVGPSRAEIHRYEIGWKYFWFDFNSPLVNIGPIEALYLAFSNVRIDPNQSNASLVLSEFLDNEIWGHKRLFLAMRDTILMALLGTLLASVVGLPLAFMAAKNITSLVTFRFILRRLFDILRGIDVLIWSIIFLRAFGPGLFTGIFAIMFTDTGTFGKIMSEAIENTDPKQHEGIRSTGASRIQQHRFGIIPQIFPVFISQSLYYLESNTRSATIIGAMGAGGVGLEFLGALQTGNDFENVAYIALMVLITVIMIDMISAWLRRRLIGIENEKIIKNARKKYI